MGRLLLILLLFSTSLISSQTSCNPTGTPVEIYYPNTTSTPTVNLGIQYLCGPNTIVYDTAIGNGCRYAYLNNNTVLWLKTGCQISQQILLKSGATLNIMAGTSPPINIIFEPGAIINNPSSVGTITASCSSITFPFVNCSVGIFEKENLNSLFSIYPNPTSNKLIIEARSIDMQFADVSIFNQLGELVLQKKDWRMSEKEINVNSLSAGLYFVQINTNKGRQTEKLVINW